MNEKKKWLITGLALALCAGTVTVSYSQPSKAQSIPQAKPVQAQVDVTEAQFAHVEDGLQKMPAHTGRGPGEVAFWPAAVAAGAAVVMAATAVAHRVHESWMPTAADGVMSPEAAYDLTSRGVYDAPVMDRRAAAGRPGL